MEVGAGRGALSGELARRAAVVAVELDEDCLPELAGVVEPYPASRVVTGDILRLDVGRLLAEHPGFLRVRAIGNLPYNIATAIVQRLLDPELPFTDLTFLVQLEMAERITARPGSPPYGYFSVLCQSRAATRTRFRVPSGVFRPPPRVQSALVSFDPHPRGLDPEIRLALDRVTRAAFGHRRKTVANAFRLAGTVGADPAGLLAAAGIAPDRRAEQIPVHGYLELARAYQKLAAGEAQAPCYTGTTANDAGID